MVEFYIANVEMRVQFPSAVPNLNLVEADWIGTSILGKF